MFELLFDRLPVDVCAACTLFYCFISYYVFMSNIPIGIVNAISVKSQPTCV